MTTIERQIGYAQDKMNFTVSEIRENVENFLKLLGKVETDNMSLEFVQHELNKINANMVKLAESKATLNACKIMAEAE